MDDSKTVIVFARGTGYRDSQMLGGFREYLRKHRLRWEVMLLRAGRFDPGAILGGEERRAVVGAINSKLAAALLEVRADACLVSCFKQPERSGGQVACVVPDDRAIARVALDHLLSRGYTNVGFLSKPTRIHPRYRHFSALSAERGIPCHPGWKQPNRSRPRAEVVATLVDWVRTRPKPLGLFFHQDLDADFHRALLRDHGVEVPREVGIVGVDNDAPLCLSDAPTLSSVDVPWGILGHEMGAQVHRLLSGAPSPAEPVRIPAYRVEARESTAGPSAGDPLVADAGRWIDRHYAHPTPIPALAGHLGVSPSTLYRRFRVATGDGVRAAILRRRMVVAAAELRDTGRAIADVARTCGFSSRGSFEQAFRRATGTSPAAFRRAHAKRQR